jgi:hypothetical protein
MKINEKQIQHMAKKLLESMKAQNCIEFKEKEEKVFEKVIQIIREDFERESRLDQEVNKMMDDLERQNPGGFQRYKMFPMLKKRLAKEKGIIL